MKYTSQNCYTYCILEHSIVSYLYGVHCGIYYTTVCVILCVCMHINIQSFGVTCSPDYQMAVVAKAMSKPFYVVAECFKFVREYPLTQSDTRNPDKVRVMCVVSVSVYTLSV